jgi:uncharacterized NAD-dependent epimerase/dehydratase family protein
MTIIRTGTTETTKLSIEADGSNVITIATGQSNVLTISDSGINIVSDTFVVPTGNTAERPVNAIIGEIRFNTDIVKLEGYDGTNWANVEP